MAKMTLEQLDFLGWRDCWRLDNGTLRLTVVPQIGGRVLVCEFDGHNLFYINQALAGKLFTAAEQTERGPYSWPNYGGSKTWPAPQGWSGPQQWPGPPDPILDGGPYTVTAQQSDAQQVSLTMTSQPDPYTGVQLTRRLSLKADSTAAELQITMQNVSKQPVRWAIWEISQLAAGLAGEPAQAARIYLPLQASSRFADGYLVLHGDPASPQWQPAHSGGLLTIAYAGLEGKVGVDGAEWVAFSRSLGQGSYVFSQRTRLEPAADYPDGGLSAECWCNGVNAGTTDRSEVLWYMESEVLGPLREMQPGAAQQLTIHWGVAASSGPVVAVGALACTSQPLAVTDGLASGSFGLYYPGKAALLATIAEQQRYLSTTWTVAAGRPLSFAGVAVPPNCQRLQLLLHDADGQPLGLLGEWLALQP